MRLPFLRPREPATERPRPPADEPEAIALARRRARQRLVGALVLLVAGVVVFPLIFETQPRPLPLNTPILVQRGDAAEAPPPAPKRAATPPPALPPADAEAELPAVAASASAAPAQPALAPVQAPQPKPQPQLKPAAPQASVTAATPTAPPPRPASAPASVPSAARFVVQVGAFTDANTLREARQRVEKLGLKTYTQVIEGDAGKRTRVRVGPFDSRAEAEATVARLKRAGLGGNVLAL
ncbi:DedD protein [Rubrivivax sp. A210]|uniref:SPOR domain-containing protein n=1 Tax=Rubrivivax sp. A210 TaxID=2772301 RepID=UPI00191A155D|nr:SPOR domain-containing protein [Rubrivivax sp. A210]CAD5372396.1 DedD protein [Rubrivivax sp. A210]